MYGITSIFTIKFLFEGRVGHDSVVGIATHCKMEVLRIEYWWGRDFPCPSILVLRPTQLPVNWLPCLFPGTKRPERGFDHQHAYSVEVTGRIPLLACCAFIAGHRFKLKFTSI
jgi:hypothetical protein